MGREGGREKRILYLGRAREKCDRRENKNHTDRRIRGKRERGKNQ